MSKRYTTEQAILERIDFWKDWELKIIADPDSWAAKWIRKPNIEKKLEKLKDKLAEFRTPPFPELCGVDRSVPVK